MVCSLWFRVEGLGLRVLGLEFEGLGVWGLGFRFQGLKYKVSCSGVWGCKVWRWLGVCPYHVRFRVGWGFITFRVGWLSGRFRVGYV